MDIFELLQKLSESYGPSGYEQRIAALISDLWEPLTDEITIDRIGSVLATKNGTGAEPRPRLLLAAHMDEIGLMVTELLEHGGYGFLRVINLGGVDIRHLYAQNVVVHGSQDLPGVLAALPARFLPEDRRTHAYGYEDLVVDTGLPIETMQNLVDVGDFISFSQPLRRLMGNTITGKALDNRASVAALTVCLELLSNRSFYWDVIAVATAQEETRLLGAYTSAFSQMPDAAVAIDVGFAKGAAYSDASAIELDSGPGLEIGPNIHPGIYQALKNTADAIEMDTTLITHARASGTDAYGIQVSRSGVPTALVSIPLRYMHTMVETIECSDVERVGRLLAEFVTRLDANFLDRNCPRVDGWRLTGLAGLENEFGVAVVVNEIAKTNE